MYRIPFNKPFISGNELNYIKDAVDTGKISGDGKYTRLCQQFFEARYGYRKTLLTSSCTDALEMAALLCNIQPGDEVIAPSYTFVSTVNPFILRGAIIRFADSRGDHPGIDELAVEKLINPKTKAIVVTHYAGIACNMQQLQSVAQQHQLWLIEDAAHAIDAYFEDRPLGGIGHMAAFSFHETKNIISGEGGMLVLNDPQLVERAEIIREKGTDRSKFFRGETDKYRWVDVGSSFLPSDITAAFLFAQLENIDMIQERRKYLWNQYREGFALLAHERKVRLPYLPPYASNNAHIFYLISNSPAERDNLIQRLAEVGILAVFHYLPLHNSPYFVKRNNGAELPMSVYFSDHLLRLPLFYSLSDDEQQLIINHVYQFYGCN
ncbi:dTDP-4-amino-4,6-dideoxygalactose transaminase [Segetibacter sp. 3557_3]|uniref:dTDP-4-amino-4,6-dideoxygalactose transaminase n=1 Tax=Segetibacter sp. 3557_3 TaxID=2547429 RepID=UPI001058EC78|nr:dTDP-4-amino-4,6-dideoxygalactose transaminase [Segetibacter sp. 3557_3]TDH27809.1 dTDP-4-amino-4,6-dideoxygalactose transaminase [Segetibacter sp. 3557_3]